MAKKFYAVRSGIKPGVYYNWDECQENIKGVTGAVFKSFKTEKEAWDFVNGVNSAVQKEEDPFDTEAVAYVDGSCEDLRKTFDGQQVGEHPAKYAYGVAMLVDGKEIHISGTGDHPEMAAMRNVAGEIMGSMVAMQYAYRNNIKSITIVHDYQGIASWCNGDWKAKNTCTQEYQKYYHKISQRVFVKFRKVKGHSGDFYNDVVDALAKQALGIDITKKMKDYIEQIKNKE